MSESVNEQKVFGSFARYVLTFCRNSATIRVAEGDILSVKNKYQLCDVIDCCKDQRSEQRKKNSLKVRSSTFQWELSCGTGVDKASTQMNEAFCPRDRHCECEGAPNRSF